MAVVVAKTGVVAKADAVAGAKADADTGFISGIWNNPPRQTIGPRQEHSRITPAPDTLSLFPIHRDRQGSKERAIGDFLSVRS